MFNKLKTIKLWNLLWISLILVEVFTAIMNTIMGLLWWGRIDLDLLLIGTVDAFVVGLIVTVILILLFREIRKYERHSEEAILAAKEEWERTFNSMTDLIMIVDTKHKVVRANKAMSDKLRLTPSETVGITCYEHVHGFTEPPSFCPHARCLLDGKEHSAEVYEERLGGHYLVTVAPLFSAKGEVVGSVHTARDISERKRTEAAMRETNAARERQLQFTETLLKAIPIAVFFKDAEGRYLGCNEEFTKIMGVAAEDIAGKTVFDLWPGEQSEMYHRKDLELLRNPEHQSYEFKVTDCTGTILDVVFNKYVFMDEKGQVGGIIGAFLDISARKRAEEKLRETNTMLQALIQAIPDVIFFKDAQSRYLIANRATEDFTGLRQEQLQGKTDEELLPPELAEDCRKSDDAVTQTLKVVRFEEQYTRADKKGFLDTIKAPVFDDQGNLAGLVGVSRDITERKHMEEDLQRSSREKDTLLQEIHHRVKNNMQVISSLLNLQAKSINDPRMSAIFEDCQSRIRSMALVHEELYQSKNLSQIDIKHYINALLHGLSSSVYRKATVRFKVIVDDLFFNIDTAIPCGLIITELVTNSFKHAFPKQTEGEIALELHRKDELFHLSVRDNGAGLPPGFDPAKTQSLGLQLIHTLARQLGGMVEMKSVHGTETTIVFKERKNKREVH